jgi:fatty-acyl-CoA synthase
MADVAHLVRRAVREFPGNVAVDDGSSTRTFAQLGACAERLANALGGLVPPGAAVGILSENRVEYPELDLGLLLSGRVRVGLNARLHLDDFRHVARDCEMRALFFSERFAAEAAALAEDAGLVTIGLDPDTGATHDYSALLESATAEIVEHDFRPDETAVITYTSGTTGLPKGIELSRRSVKQVALALLIDLDRPSPGELIVLPQPLSHGAGYFVLPYLTCGAGLYVMDRYDAELVLELSRRPNINTLKAVPAMLPPLLDAQSAPREHGFDTVIYGAAPIGPALLERALDELGPVLMQIYGQSEAPMAITCLRKEDHLVADDRRFSAGRPWRTVDIEIRDADGNRCAPGTPGEVVVDAPQLMTRYLNQPDVTASVIRNGWLHTRDMGKCDEHGFVHLLGRTDEMIISGGFNIAPREVERAVEEVDAVAECVVVGVADERWGERVTAVVTSRNGSEMTEDGLMSATKERLGFRNPTQVVIVEAIPKNAYGKVDRAALRDLIPTEGA